MRDGPHQRVGRGPRVMGHHDGHAPRMTCAGSDAVVACIDWVARVRLTKGVFSLAPQNALIRSRLLARVNSFPRRNSKRMRREYEFWEGTYDVAWR
jgi:hypothetical protein